MGFFTNEKYEYWECSVTGQFCNIKMIDMDTEEKEKELQQIIGKVQEYSKEKEELKRKKKATKDNGELSVLNRKILDIESQYRTEYAKGKREEEKLDCYRRYSRIIYQIIRLKDIYSREEAVLIQVINKDIEDGMIITSTSKIAEDIYKLEKYGIAMSPLYFDELAKIIKSNYFDIEITERDYIDNEIPQKVIQVFAESCREKMGSNLENYLAKDKVHYDVRTTDLSAWHKESPVRRYALKDIKEAMIIYGYVDKPTKGRTDCTIGGQKVIRFYRNIIDKIEYAEDENE